MDKNIYLRLKQKNLKSKKNKLIKFFEIITLYFKQKFNIVTKKNINGINIWILPYIDNISIIKLEKIIKKELKYLDSNSKLVLSKDLKKKETIEILKKYNINYVTGNIAKKELLFKVLEFLNKLQNIAQKDRDVTILVDKNTYRNMVIINRLALECKSIKIVSKDLNKFRKLEEKLYSEKGIAMQFSNNYRKSLKSSSFIINLDFDEKEINKYSINTNAIIINTNNKILIKTKSFNGIIINSYKILFMNIFNTFENNIFNSFEKLDIYEDLYLNNNLVRENNIKIVNTLGNNGIISEKEFKNISQKY